MLEIHTGRDANIIDSLNYFGVELKLLTKIIKPVFYTVHKTSGGTRNDQKL